MDLHSLWLLSTVHFQSFVRLVVLRIQLNLTMNTKELDLNEAETVSGGKLRYKEIEKYLTEEQKKELEELERRVANS